MMPKSMPMRPPGRRGFTLVEILVVLVIVALISAVALPVVLPALSERRVSEGARIFQAVLSGARDAAIRANAPRGIRLLPDPVFNNAQVLASNRMVTIQPAADYSEGYIAPATLPTGPGQFLQINEVVSQSVATASGNVTIPNPPTGWYFNIRQGDRIRFGQSGAYYTVAGPMQQAPSASASTVNPERFVNNGLGFAGIEILHLVNGVDDDNDGWVDEGFDGIDNDGDGIIDPGFNGIDDDGVNGIDDAGELTYVNRKVIATGGGEYETETFLGTQSTTFTAGSTYTIFRRPVISPGTNEVTLPEGIVIDLTTWNASRSTPVAAGTTPVVQLPERSRVPVDPYTYYVDIMISPSGQVIQAGSGQADTNSGGNNGLPSSNLPFYHFWLTDRVGVVAPLWDSPAASVTSTYSPALNPSSTSKNNPVFYLLPMPQGTAGYTPMPDNANGGTAYSGNPTYLKGERRLITLFTKSGQIVTNSIELFNASNINVPYYAAQAGIKEQQ